MALEVTELVGKSSGPDNFTEMPTVGGDPIVESGSNSDGDWTRWADGTQIVRHNVTLTYAGASSVKTTWTFPVPFSAAGVPQVSHSAIGSSNVAPSASDIGWNICYSSGETSSALEVYRVSGGSNFVSGDTMPTDAFAIGRWK